MGFLGWMALGGALLLLMALSSAYLRRLPLTTSIIYLGVGVVLGPLALDRLEIDLVQAAPWFERATEVGVIVSLFVGGVKLRLPLSDPAWSAALWLAGPAMLLTIAGVAAFGRLALGLDTGTALLLGAVLAPTDPVLAGTVRVAHAGDHDRLRYGLSGEAGLNDGTAFPFVVFGLDWLRHGGPAAWMAPWLLHRLVWAVPAGLALGYGLGKRVGRLAIRLRARHRDTAAPNDFLALALIALAYAGAEAIGAWGFLAVFAAGVGLRHAEVQVVSRTPHPTAGGRGAAGDAGRKGRPFHPPAETLVSPGMEGEALAEPSVAAGLVLAETISFGDTLERLVEVALVVVVGAALAAHWEPRAIALGPALILIIRPAAALLALARAPLQPRQRGLMAWFGIRGIGSLYYLSYAVRHGLPAHASAALAGLSLPVIAMSILAHGATAELLLARYERALAAEGTGSASDRRTGTARGS